MRIYISGPITDNPHYMYDFEIAENRLKQIYPDAEVINPAKISQLLPKSFSWEEYMAICIPLMMRADGLYMLKGWENSKGASAERDLAQRIRIAIKEE